MWLSGSTLSVNQSEPIAPNTFFVVASTANDLSLSQPLSIETCGWDQYYKLNDTHPVFNVSGNSSGSSGSGECVTTYSLSEIVGKRNESTSICNLRSVAVCQDAECTNVTANDPTYTISQDGLSVEVRSCVAREPSTVYLGLYVDGGKWFTHEADVEVCGWEVWTANTEVSLD